MKRINLGGILKLRTIGIGLSVVAAFGLGLVVSPLLFDRADDNHAGHGNEQTEKESGASLWTCSMHPQVKQSEPGRCPLCGMDLIPLKDENEAPGPNTAVLSERAKILARIGTSEVKRQRNGGTALRLLGRIEPSEASMKSITAWTGGRIDKLHVKVTGQSVRKGQVIATMYSPEVFAAHQDLIVAGRQVARMADSTVPSAKQAAKRALEASKSRLRLLGVPGHEIEEMARSDKPTRQIAIRTPFAGTVMERVATEGAYVDTGALLYKVADLSRVWIQLDAYETDLPSVAKGQAVEIYVEGIPNEIFEGAVEFIDPVVDASRRTARVRVAVRNKNRLLRPGMFVEANLKTAPPSGTPLPLVIPSSAPLFTGRRAVVFVEEPNRERPTYTARTVRLGPKKGEVYPVVAGLSEGERVVTKGAFTLDAELQIRGGRSMMSAEDDSATIADPIIRITERDRKRLAPVLDAYLDLSERLAADDFEKAKSAASMLAERSSEAVIKGPAAAAGFWKQHSTGLRRHAARLAESEQMEKARGIFETVSRHIIEVLERLGNPLDTPVRLAFCPMAMGSKGAFWVQRGEVVDNAYFGDLMRTCGEIKRTIEAGQYLMREKKPVEQVSAVPAQGHSH